MVHCVLEEGEHWRQLANTTEPAVCGCDAYTYDMPMPVCQITLIACYCCCYGETTIETGRRRSTLISR